jgi:hypothetical protein
MQIGALTRGHRDLAYEIGATETENQPGPMIGPIFGWAWREQLGDPPSWSELPKVKKWSGSLS